MPSTACSTCLPSLHRIGAVRRPSQPLPFLEGRASRSWQGKEQIPFPENRHIVTVGCCRQLGTRDPFRDRRRPTSLETSLPLSAPRPQSPPRVLPCSTFRSERAPSRRVVDDALLIAGTVPSSAVFNRCSVEPRCLLQIGLLWPNRS